MTETFGAATTGLWPGGHRAALAIVVAVDGSVSASDDPTKDPGIDYTATGLQRLLNLLADFDTSVTTAWSEPAMNGLPQLLRRVADAEHEVAAWFGADQLPAADSTFVAALKRVSGTTVSGSVGNITATSSFGADATGFAWQISGAGGDLPTVKGGTNDQPLSVMIPISPYWVDRTWLHPDRPLPPSSLLEAWSASLAAVRADGSLMTVVLHPHVILRPGFAATFTRFLDEAIASGDVWIARIDRIAQWWADRQSL